MGGRCDEYAGHARSGISWSFQELCTETYYMGPCIFRWCRWIKSMTVDLRISSLYPCGFKFLWIKCAYIICILCLLIPLPHHHHGALCSQCSPKQTTQAFKVPDAIKGEHMPIHVNYLMNSSQVKAWWGRISLPEMFLTVGAEIL